MFVLADTKALRASHGVRDTDIIRDAISRNPAFRKSMDDLLRTIHLARVELATFSA